MNGTDDDNITSARAGEAGRENVHAALGDTVATCRSVASILRAMASAAISAGHDLDECSLDWLGQQIDAAANRAADALDEMRRGVRA